jgi:tRNA(Ile)-lysidine synthase TilS/MesJ
MYVLFVIQVTHTIHEQNLNTYELIMAKAAPRIVGGHHIYNSDQWEQKQLPGISGDSACRLFLYHRLN